MSVWEGGKSGKFDRDGYGYGATWGGLGEWGNGNGGYGEAYPG